MFWLTFCQRRQSPCVAVVQDVSNWKEMDPLLTSFTWSHTKLWVFWVFSKRKWTAEWPTTNLPHQNICVTFGDCNTKWTECSFWWYLAHWGHSFDVLLTRKFTHNCELIVRPVSYTSLLSNGMKQMTQVRLLGFLLPWSIAIIGNINLFSVQVKLCLGIDVNSSAVSKAFSTHLVLSLESLPIAYAHIFPARCSTVRSCRVSQNFSRQGCSEGEHSPV